MLLRVWGVLLGRSAGSRHSLFFFSALPSVNSPGGGGGGKTVYQMIPVEEFVNEKNKEKIKEMKDAVDLIAKRNIDDGKILKRLKQCDQQIQREMYDKQEDRRWR